MADNDGVGVTCSVDGRVATLAFANPTQRGALTPEILRSLQEELEALVGHPGPVSTVVLRGADDVFSSGYAIDRIPDPEALAVEDEIEQLCGTIESSPLVVIAMLQGFAVGAALDVASSCDLRFATRQCRLGITPAKLGLVYTVNGMARIHRLVGPDWTRTLFFTADLIDGEQASRIGLVSQACEDAGELQRITYDCAHLVASRAPRSLVGSKQILREIEAHSTAIDVATLDHFHELRRAALRSPDAAEAREAFAAKRPPRFTGEERQ